MLLTRSPLYSHRSAFSFDLHVLSTPPAFVLSQDQTLHEKCCSPNIIPKDEERWNLEGPVITKMNGLLVSRSNRLHADQSG